MKSRRILVALLLALTISGGCTYLLSRRLASNQTIRRVADQQYVAPARALQAGEVLKADNLESVAWPADNPIHGASLRTADLIGRVVLYPLERGEPILERELAAPGSGIGLAGRIPNGMRAIALRSDEVVGVAGFLIPGSHLDVLVTYRTDKSPEPVTATVLQDAVVLAAGQQAEPDPAGKPIAVTVVTLLLTPEESERAFLASNQGTIHFVLRNGADKGRTNDAPVSLSQLSAGIRVETSSLKALVGMTKRNGLASLGLSQASRSSGETGIETVLGDARPADKQIGGSKQ